MRPCADQSRRGLGPWGTATGRTGEEAHLSQDEPDVHLGPQEHWVSLREGVTLNFITVVAGL